MIYLELKLYLEKIKEHYRKNECKNCPMYELCSRTINSNGENYPTEWNI
jgi:hypothetical protein